MAHLDATETQTDTTGMLDESASERAGSRTVTPGDKTTTQTGGGQTTTVSQRNYIDFSFKIIFPNFTTPCKPVDYS